MKNKEFIAFRHLNVENAKLASDNRDSEIETVIIKIKYFKWLMRIKYKQAEKETAFLFCYRLGYPESETNFKLELVTPSVVSYIHAIFSEIKTSRI